MNIEGLLLHKLLEEQDYKIIKEQQIDSSFFEGVYKNVFVYIQDVYMKVRELPTLRVVKSKYPNAKLEDGEESLRFLCEELRLKNKHNKTADLLEDVAETLAEGKSLEGFTQLKEGLGKIDKSFTITEEVDITKDTEDRVEKYLERKKNKGIVGLRSGFPTLDRVTGGFVESTLTTIMAKSGVGKSWLEIIMGAEMQLNNLKVLQFVTEMSSDVMRDRYEAILFSKMYGSFNYGSFKSGNLDSKTEKDFFRFLREDLPCLEPLKILTATDILSVQEGILEEDPDIVFIDGVYLMQDIQGAKEEWKRVTNITRGLKLLAKNLKKPIVMNTQTDLKSQNGGIESVKYAQAIIQDSDVVIELWRNSQHILDKEAQMKVLKNREGIPTNITSAWDFKHMNFDEIYSETAEGAEAKEEDEVPVSGAILGVEEED